MCGQSSLTEIKQAQVAGRSRDGADSRSLVTGGCAAETWVGLKTMRDVISWMADGEVDRETDVSV